MELIEMGKEYTQGQDVYVMCDNRMVPAEYIRRRGRFHEVFVKSRYFIEDENVHFEREFERE
jgi:hypothetical protein